jgi:hypothetical protein
MGEKVSNNAIVVAVENQVSSDLGGEVAILDLKLGVYYGLDEVGARVWELIQEPRVVDEVRDVLLEEYDVVPERCERAGLGERAAHPEGHRWPAWQRHDTGNYAPPVHGVRGGRHLRPGERACGRDRWLVDAGG